MARMECKNLPSCCESPLDRGKPTTVAQFVLLWPIDFATLGLPMLLTRYAALLTWKHIFGPTAEERPSAPVQTVMLGAQYLGEAQTASNIALKYGTRTKTLGVKVSLEELQHVVPTAPRPSPADSAARTPLWPVKPVLMPDILSAGLLVAAGPALQEPVVALPLPKLQVPMVGMVAATPNVHGRSAWCPHW